MAPNTLALAVALATLVCASTALADVYTWVDEQGNMHISDTPRRGAKRLTPQPASSGAAAAAEEQAQAGPISYRGKVPSLRLALTAVQLELPTGGQKRVRVGREYHGYHCNSRAEHLLVDTSKKLNGSSMLPRDFHRRLAELAYQPPQFVSRGGKKVAIAELQAVPTVTELSLKACSRRGRTRRERLPNKSLVEVSVRWQVTDRLSQELIFEGETQGRFDRWNNEYTAAEKDTGISTATRNALLLAGEQLLANPEFAALLSPDGILPTHADSTPAAAASIFQASLPAVRRATPMIRTVRGNGHGVLISAGHVLTNYRVIASGREVSPAPVMVVFESESIRGRVIRADQSRGVALIELERAAQTGPLRIAKHGIGISEPVYVVGGPLDDTLAHAVSEGVITADRNLRGSTNRYYLTNAPVDRDNATGPALNERGEVVALATGLGHSRTPGANYLIPIDEALKTLGFSP